MEYFCIKTRFFTSDPTFCQIFVLLFLGLGNPYFFLESTYSQNYIFFVESRTIHWTLEMGESTPRRSCAGGFSKKRVGWVRLGPGRSPLRGPPGCEANLWVQPPPLKVSNPSLWCGGASHPPPHHMPSSLATFPGLLTNPPRWTWGLRLLSNPLGANRFLNPGSSSTAQPPNRLQIKSLAFRRMLN